MIPCVEVSELTKSYGKKTALSRLSFAVPRGSIYGLIGANGAGKTTCLSILAGLISPDAGRVSVLGMDVVPNRRELMSRIGFASPQFSLFDYLKGDELMLTCALMHGINKDEAERRVRDLLVLLQLEPAASQYIYQYSHGMRQKLGLACAFVHAPEVLFLDEPFAGLDPTSVYRLSHTVRQMAAAGRTVLLTSHDLTLVERLCDRVGILHEGVLKREIEPRAMPGLESALWEIVGSPETAELSWL